MKYILGLAAAVLLLGCGKKEQPSAVEAEQHRSNAVEVESQRLAEEKAYLRDKIAEKREAAAMDLELRSQKRNAQRADLLEAAATEQARRESVVADLRDTIDGMDFSGERKSESGVRYIINGRVVKDGDLLKSDAGYTFAFTGKQGDYYAFSYADDFLNASFKRPSGGVCVVTAKHIAPLAPGVDAIALDGNARPSIQSNHPTRSGRITIVSASYGVGSTQRDVRDILRSRTTSDGVSFRVDNGDLGGDPVPGQVKTLAIRYSVGGQSYDKSFREGEQISLP